MMGGPHAPPPPMTDGLKNPMSNRIKKRTHKKLQPALGVNFLLFVINIHLTYKKRCQPDPPTLSYWWGLAVNSS